MNTIREKKKSIKRVCNDLSMDACHLVKVQTTDWDFTKIVVEETTTFPVLVRSFFYCCAQGNKIWCGINLEVGIDHKEI